MAAVQVDPQEFGEVKQMVSEMHGVIMHERCPLGIKNKINMRWMWAAVCGLGSVSALAFVFLYNLV